MELKDWVVGGIIAIVMLILTLGARFEPTTQLAAKGFDGKVPTVMVISPSTTPTNTHGSKTDVLP